jgi:phosphate/sulfate permease
MSIKNEDTWQVAHKRCGVLFLRGGIAMSILTVAVMLAVLGKDVHVISNVGSVLVFVPIVAIIVCSMLTDRTLKQTFDKDGNRLQK